MAGHAYLEIEREKFTWRVAKGHYWAEGKVITVFIAGEPKPPFLIPARGGEEEREPLKLNPALFLEFASLETPDQILRFADRYGMLTEGEVTLNLKAGYDREETLDELVHLPKDERLSRNLQGYLFGEFVNAESLDFWKRESRKMRCFAALYEAAQTYNPRDIRTVKRIENLIVHYPREKVFSVVFPDDEVPVERFLISGIEEPEAYKRMVDGGPLVRAREFMARMVNEKLSVYNLHHPSHMAAVPQAYVDEEGNVGSYLEPSTLLCAMWIQALRALVGETRYKRCLECGMWEDVTDRRVNWRMHPACATKRRMREMRERRKGDGHHRKAGR